MAVSAFKSTSKRGDFSRTVDDSDLRVGSSKSNSDTAGKKTVLRRSRSVSAFLRDNPSDRSGPGSLDSMSRRDNPLFCSSPESPRELEGVNHRISDLLDVDKERILSATSQDKSGSGPGIAREWKMRGRSVCRTEPSRAGPVKAPCRSVSDVDTGRRQRSVSRGPHSRRESLRAGSVKAQSRNVSDVDTGRRQRSVSRGPDCRTESSRAGSMTAPGRSASNTGRRRPLVSHGHYRSPSKQASDSEEGFSTFGQGAGEEKIIEAVFEQMKCVRNAIPPGDSCVSESHETVRSEIRHALFEAQERMRNLNANLAVEGQRTQELTRILKEALPDPNMAGSSGYQAKKKYSMKRAEISKRLAENAINYFDECVSLSTFNGSDISSVEESTNNIGAATSLIDDSKQCSSAGTSTPSDPSLLNQVFEKQAGDLNSFVHSNLTIMEGSDSNQCDSLIGSRTNESRNFQFSIGRGVEKNTEVIQDLIKRFGKEIKKADAGDDLAHASYDEDRYLLHEISESLLFEKVKARNRINSGSLILCTPNVYLSSF